MVFYGGQTTINFEGLGIGRAIRSTEEDLSMITSASPGIAYARPQYGQWVTRLQYKDRITTTYMGGVNPDFEIMRTMYPVSGGRFINEQDVALQRRTLFLGDQIAGTLFGGEDPGGKEILLNGTPFTVGGTRK